MTMNLPEVQTLGKAADLIASVQGDARRCGLLLAELRVTTDAELRERWKPIIEEGIDEVVKASEVLHEAVELMHSQSKGWTKSGKGKTILEGLLTTSKALTGLVARLESAKADTGARDLLVRMRSHSMGKLPPADRREAQRRLYMANPVSSLALSGVGDG